jgi:hypothetical protein
MAELPSITSSALLNRLAHFAAISCRQNTLDAPFYNDFLRPFSAGLVFLVAGSALQCRQVSSGWYSDHDSRRAHPLLFLS